MPEKTDSEIKAEILARQPILPNQRVCGPMSVQTRAGWLLAHCELVQPAADSADVSAESVVRPEEPTAS